MAIIYCYTNKITGKRYVGQTINEKSRQRMHKRFALILESKCRFHEAIREYGLDNFDYEILEYCDNESREFLSEREKYWIETLDTLYPNGYNEVLYQCYMSPEVRQKISEAHKGKRFTEEHRAKIAAASAKYRHTQESKEKISQANKGKERTPEMREKMSQSHLGKPRGPHTEETKEKIRQAKIGKPLSEEHKKKIGTSRLGKKQGEYQKQKAREAKQKEWLVTFPDGKQEVVINLRNFCKNHGLDWGNLSRVGNNIPGYKQHKGFQCKKLSD